MTRGKEPEPNRRRTSSPSSEKAGKPPSPQGAYTHSTVIWMPWEAGPEDPGQKGKYHRKAFWARHGVNHLTALTMGSGWHRRLALGSAFRGMWRLPLTYFLMTLGEGLGNQVWGLEVPFVRHL